jgi:hypothetical protein
MRVSLTFFCVILTFCLSSFKISKNEMEGIWMFNAYTGYYEQINYRPRSRSYFHFRKDGKLIFKQSQNACGSLEEIDSTSGKWKISSDTTITLEYTTCIDRTYAIWNGSRDTNGKLRYKLLAFAGNYK